MKICILYFGNYPNFKGPMDRRIHFYLKSLYHENIPVKIFIPSSGYEYGVYEGIPFEKILIPINSFMSKFLYLYHIKNLTRKLGFDYDILFTNAKDNFLINVIRNGLRNTNCKLVLEINENPYSFKASRLDFVLFRKIQRLIFFKYTLKKINGAITITDALYNLLKKNCDQKIHILVLPILTELNSDYNRNYKSNIPFILHAGSFSENKDGIKAMMKAFLIAHKHLNGNIKFLFTYSTALPSIKIWFKKFIRINNLTNSVSILGIVSNDKLNDLYQKCSLAIVNKPHNEQNAYNFPSKISSLITRKVPLIVSKTGILPNYFIDGYNSCLVDPDNHIQISNCILKILKDKQFSEYIADNAFKLAENDFNYLTHSYKLKLYFQEINNLI